MKYLASLLLVILSLNLHAQIKGSKNIMTKSFPLENLTALEMNLYAEVVVDCSAKEEITIAADENLFDLIDFSIESGKLVLSQKEWIQPSEKIKIKIGAPNLEFIQNTVHETTIVKNIKRDNFSAMAIIGKLVLEGKTKTLNANGEIGEIDARSLSAKTVHVNLWSRGKILLENPELIKGKVKDNGLVLYNSLETKSNVNTIDGGRIQNKASKKVEVEKEGPEWIDFKIKNNSLNRIQCYVKGPKADGSEFSYGFPMNPGQVRKKNWTVGSKVFRVTRLGTKKLLLEIKATDKGKVVKMYE